MDGFDRTGKSEASATSPAQIRTLWSKVGELLGDEPTRLEARALAIEPIEEA